MSGNEHDDILSAALRAVADEDRHAGASPAVKRRLLVEVQSMARPRRGRAWKAPLAAAAALLTAIALPAWYAVRSGSAIVDRPSGGNVVERRPREETTEFFPLPYSEVPAPGGYMVRMQVPRAALTSFGVTSFGTPDDTSPTVLAEVLVGGDGLARAVRFVHVVHSGPQEQQ